jgi:hypothetical protein
VWGCMTFRGIVFISALCVGSSCFANDEGPQQLTAVESGALRTLKGLPREWSRSSRRDCKTYEDKNIDRLSPAFAASAAAFLTAFVETHLPVTITSAHRTSEEQACVCDGERGLCAGRPRMVKGKKGRRYVKRTTSRHQGGIALDVRPGAGSEAEFACMHEFAQLNPHLGVHFPLGQRDRPHMEPSTNKPVAVRLASLGSFRSSIAPCTKLPVTHTEQALD